MGGSPLRLVVKTAIIFIVLGVFVYDISAILMTRYASDEIAQTVADSAATNWRSSGRDQQVTIAIAMKVAEQKGAQLIGFTAEDKEISVKIRMHPKETLLAHYIGSLKNVGNGESVASSSVVW